MAELGAENESTEARKARIIKALLEIYTTDPEEALRRREQLEAISFYGLRAQRIGAIGKLHQKLQQYKGAVKINKLSSGSDNWQLTLPPVDNLGSVTIQASPVTYGTGIVRIFTGAASELLSKSGSDEIDYGNYTEDVVIASPLSGSAGSLGMQIAHSSIKDMQGVVESVLLLEALTEQLNSGIGSNIAASAGKIAVRAE
jgi:hypothetical protein